MTEGADDPDGTEDRAVATQMARGDGADAYWRTGWHDRPGTDRTGITGYLVEFGGTTQPGETAFPAEARHEIAVTRSRPRAV